MNERFDTVLKIIRLYFSNDYPGSLKEEVQAWLADGTGEEEKDAALRILFDEIMEGTSSPGPDARASLRAWKAGVGVDGRMTRGKKRVSRRRVVAWVAAACVPVAVAVGMLFYPARDETRETPAPAVLNSLSVAGDPGEMTLADGSNVWVNERSTVRYTGERVAYVEGEAYFEVKKGEEKPFVVRAGRLEISVHGTEFNVKSYPGAGVTVVTLYGGSVRVRDSLGEQVMRPGEQLYHDDASGEWHVSRVGEARPAWMSSRMRFAKVALEEVFKRIEWYYHVTIERDPRLDATQRVVLSLAGDEELTEVLFLLEQLCGDFTCEVTGDRVTVRVIE
jgi:ferric-dicitrate binding protein FerR (iron transport regulator)